MQTPTNSQNFAHITCLSKSKLERLLYLLVQPYARAGPNRLNAGDRAMHRKEPEDIGQLVRVLTVPSDEETRYYVQIVSEYAGTTFWSEAD
jgi:hypothetical protein